MKVLNKLVFGLAVVFLCLGFDKGVYAYSAEPVSNGYYPDLLTEVYIDSKYKSQIDNAVANYQYFLVYGLVHDTGNVSYGYCFSDVPFEVYCKTENGRRCAYIVDDLFVLAGEGALVDWGVFGTETDGLSLTESRFIIGSNCTYVVKSGYESQSAEIASLPQCNLYHPSGFFFGEQTSVSVVINETEYTLSESLPYYFVFDDGYGNIQVLFSDAPFYGSWFDLYTKQLVIDSEAKVVSYYWDSLEQNDFISSRSVSTGYSPFSLKSSSDYMCNYTLYYLNDDSTVFLEEKDSFDSSVDYTLEELCSNIPEELKKYQCFIIFRQNAPSAMDDRIIFYGWNGLTFELCINSVNSQICAIKGENAVSDYITAYYDEIGGSWVISDDVILGATNDLSYHVPKIYYTNSTLFLADSYWNNTGDVVEMASLSLPPFSENAEGDEEDGLLSKFYTGLSNVLKYLFVPSSSFIEKKLDGLASNFDFWESVRDTVDVFLNFLNETDFTEPPKIKIDLSGINSIVDYGGSAFILDLSWYAPYKESVDFILSSILWLCFVWNTFRNLPNIISGVGSGVLASTSLMNEERE